MLGHWHLMAGRFDRSAAITDIAGQGLLSAIDVDGGDAMTLMQQIDGQMQRRGRFARPSLFIAYRNDVRAGLHHVRLSKSETDP